MKSIRLSLHVPATCCYHQSRHAPQVDENPAAKVRATNDEDWKTDVLDYT